MHITAAESSEGFFILLRRKDFWIFHCLIFFLRSILYEAWYWTILCQIYVSGLDALSEGARLHRRVHATHSCGPPTGTAATPSSSAHPTASAGTATTAAPCSTPAA
jgi:hypothetical protein